MQLVDFANPESFPKRVRELPKKFLPLPDLSGLKKGGFSKSAPFQATLEVIVHALLQKFLTGYDKNRAGQPINFSQIKRWFGKEGEGLCVEVLGEIPFGELPNEEAMTLSSHHHRMCFLLYLYWMASDEVWQQIKKEILSCRVYDAKKLTTLYVKDNDKTKHSKDSFLRNPDMVLGHVISCDPDPSGKFNGRLAARLSAPARNLLSSKGGYLQPLANLIYARSVKEVAYNTKGTTKDLQASHGRVYNCRQKVAKFVEMERRGNENAFPVSDALLDEVAAAVEEYIEFLDTFKGEVHKQSLTGNVELHRKIMSQTAFFAFFIYDRVIFKQLPSPKLVGERLAYFCTGPTGLGQKINELWNGDEDVIDNRCDKIIEILRKKKKK